MASSISPKFTDLDLTIVSAKHLKNVNWRHGNLKPYAVAWIESPTLDNSNFSSKIATSVDDSGTVKPVWNERFTLTLNRSYDQSTLAIDIVHSPNSSSKTASSSSYQKSAAVKPLVGSIRFPLVETLIDPAGGESAPSLYSLVLRRPSGRIQGKIKIKIGLKERLPVYPPSSSIYNHPPPAPKPASLPPPPSPSLSVRDFRSFSYQYPPLAVYESANPNPSSNLSYYSPYYSMATVPLAHSPPPPPPPPPMPPQAYYDRTPPPSYSVGPSAPFDNSSSSSGYPPYDYWNSSQKGRGIKSGLGTGLAVGAVGGAFGALALEEGVKYEEGRIVEHAEKDLALRDDRSEHHIDY